jgi:hypothetical protein
VEPLQAGRNSKNGGIKEDPKIETVLETLIDLKKQSAE